MAPSATEQVSNVAEHLKEKVLSEKQDQKSVGVQVDTDDELPELLTGHHEPLKLSGALDQFEHFDVTPIIGREYANVDLAAWLRAPNSDELLRDLAITSKLHTYQLSSVIARNLLTNHS